jgi:hypothetical protein
MYAWVKAVHVIAIISWMERRLLAAIAIARENLAGADALPPGGGLGLASYSPPPRAGSVGVGSSWFAIRRAPGRCWCR